MTFRALFSRVALGLSPLAGALNGCNTSATVAAPVPAALASSDAETLVRVQGALAAAMNRADVELGAMDPDAPSTLAVLPPPLSPYETRSPAAPAYFDIMLKGEDCLAVRRNDGVAVALPGVACRPLSK